MLQSRVTMMRAAVLQRCGGVCTQGCAVRVWRLTRDKRNTTCRSKAQGLKQACGRWIQEAERL
jgi:hypothetical protein